MIRYLQKLKRKKGFTLVELIVVVAIIGVLTSIMVPMIFHYVEDAKITSANFSASNIKKMITTYLMELDMEMKGMKRIPNSIAQMIFMCKDGKWIVEAGDMALSIGGSSLNQPLRGSFRIKDTAAVRPARRGFYAKTEVK